MNGIGMDFQQVCHHLPRGSVVGSREVAGRHGTLDRVGRGHRAHCSAISGDQARNQKTLIAGLTELQETEHRDCLSSMSVKEECHGDFTNVLSETNMLII